MTYKHLGRIKLSGDFLRRLLMLPENCQIVSMQPSSDIGAWPGDCILTVECPDIDPVPLGNAIPEVRPKWDKIDPQPMPSQPFVQFGGWK